LGETLPIQGRGLLRAHIVPLVDEVFALLGQTKLLVQQNLALDKRRMVWSNLGDESRL